MDRGWEVDCEEVSNFDPVGRANLPGHVDLFAVDVACPLVLNLPRNSRIQHRHIGPILHTTRHKTRRGPGATFIVLIQNLVILVVNSHVELARGRYASRVGHEVELPAEGGRVKDGVHVVQASIDAELVSVCSV